MREWLSWWSTTLPRSGPRVRVPSRALINLIFVLCSFEHSYHARVAQLVEHDLAKVGAAGSSPVSRSQSLIFVSVLLNTVIMREWLSWWSTTLPRSGPRVRVPSRALFISRRIHIVGFAGIFVLFSVVFLYFQIFPFRSYRSPENMLYYVRYALTMYDRK